MDPIDIANLVLEMAVGLFFILLFGTFGVWITPIKTKMSHNLPDRCFAISYEDTLIVAASFVFFAALSLGCACTIKRIYKRPVNGHDKANSYEAWKLVYVLIPLAGVTYILAFSFFLMVNQYRLGKIVCWRLVTRVFLFGACIGAIIAGFVFGMMCYFYGRDGVDAMPIFDGNGLENANLDNVNSKDADLDDIDLENDDPHGYNPQNGDAFFNDRLK